MKINNLKEAIEFLKEINKNNPNKYYKNIDLLDYNLMEGRESFEWYKAILDIVKKYNPKRVIDIGSNINLFGYLFANEGIEYIGIDEWQDVIPIQTNKIKFIHNNYYNVREMFKDDICISCLCVGYLIPIKDVFCKKLIINSSKTIGNEFICCVKEVI